jgi:hypothetical protein
VTLLVVAAIKNVKPVVVWLILSIAFFGFSQLSAENRNQRVSLGIGAFGSRLRYLQK